MSTIKEMADAVIASGDFGAAVIAHLESIKEADAIFEKQLIEAREYLAQLAARNAREAKS